MVLIRRISGHRAARKYDWDRLDPIVLALKAEGMRPGAIARVIAQLPSGLFDPPQPPSSSIYNRFFLEDGESPEERSARLAEERAEAEAVAEARMDTPSGKKKVPRTKTVSRDLDWDVLDPSLWQMYKGRDSVDVIAQKLGLKPATVSWRLQLLQTHRTKLSKARARIAAEHSAQQPVGPGHLPDTSFGREMADELEAVERQEYLQERRARRQAEYEAFFAKAHDAAEAYQPQHTSTSMKPQPRPVRTRLDATDYELRPAAMTKYRRQQETVAALKAADVPVISRSKQRRDLKVLSRGMNYPHRPKETEIADLYEIPGLGDALFEAQHPLDDRRRPLPEFLKYWNMAYRTPKGRKDLVSEAIKEFGTTTDPAVAGFILPDGRMLDLSQGQPHRVMDHRTVSRWISHDTSRYGSQTEAMLAWMRQTGALRISVHKDGFVVDAETVPTQAQLRVVGSMLRSRPEWVAVSPPGKHAKALLNGYPLASQVFTALKAS